MNKTLSKVTGYIPLITTDSATPRTVSYTVFHTLNGKETGTNITAANRFDAKYKAFTEKKIPLESITRVL